MALSLDLRKRIFAAYERNEGSIRELAERFDVGFMTVWRLLKRQRQNGNLEAYSPPGKPSKIDEKGMQLIEKLITKDKGITLIELQQNLAKKLNIEVSLMAVHRACKRLELNYKKNSLSSGATERRRSIEKKQVSKRNSKNQ